MHFPNELDEETTNAIRMLDSVVFNEENQFEDELDSRQVEPTPRARKNIPPPVAPRRRQTVGAEQDRSMTEVSDGEAVEENFEKFGVWQRQFSNLVHSIPIFFLSIIYLHGFSFLRVANANERMFIVFDNEYLI